MLKIMIMCLIILCTFPGGARAQDVEGSEDHPLISRFPDSRIVYYNQLHYDEYILGMGRYDHREREYEDSILARGKLTRKLYYLPQERSALEVYKNYEAALQRADFEILFSGAGEDELGRYGSALARSINFNSGLSSTRRGDIEYHVGGVSEQHYLLARSSIAGEDVYISVLTGGASIHRRDPIALVTIVECRDIVDDQIEVKLDIEEEKGERLVLDREDPEGSRDHPLISRFPESKIAFFTELEYDEYELGLGSWDRHDGFKESIQLEGKLTKILYQVPQDRTPLEIFRNYEAALQRADFEILYAETGEELGNYGRALYDQAYFQGGVTAISRGNIGYYLEGALNQHYLAAKTTIRDQEIYVGVLVGGASIHSSLPLILVSVVECQAMEEDLITTGDLREQIEMTGKALVYGIHFDTGSYEIKPESDEVLEEIAGLLQEIPGLNLYVVGHTDDQGSFDFNMTLSRQRANSVVNWLVQNHGIDSQRLQPVGVGPAAPESTNETAAGRAANRRVELVKKLED